MLELEEQGSLPQTAAKPRLKIYQRIIDHTFKPMKKGRLTMRLPDGNVLAYGDGRDGVSAEIRIYNNDFFKKCVFYGDIGFGESYMDGDWDTKDITAVIEWMIHNVENHPTLAYDSPKRTPVNLLRLLNNARFMFRRNSYTGSRRNIQYHYDLGNEFYKLFLDPSMTYSAAYFKSPEQSLEEAQWQKYAELCRKIHLKSDDHVLEIGSGWGGFAVYAAHHYKCRVTTVTISRQQYEYVVKRIAAEGLEGKVRVELKDYRDIKGKYDKIVSIEMLEAVGHEFYTTYFSKCHELLKTNGMLGLQMILSPDHRYQFFRKNMDWIQKHIFPGSLLPSMSVIQKAINQTGSLNLYGFEDMGLYYAKTLRMWREAFNKNRAQVVAQGFDRTFIRKWNYYLSYCEAAFQTRNITVAQAVYVRPNVAV